MLFSDAKIKWLRKECMEPPGEPSRARLGAHSAFFRVARLVKKTFRSGARNIDV